MPSGAPDNLWQSATPQPWPLPVGSRRVSARRGQGQTGLLAWPWREHCDSEGSSAREMKDDVVGRESAAVRKARTAMAVVALLAAAWLPAAAAAQAYQPEAEPGGWRAWLFSTAPATPERRLDLGVMPDDRSSRVAAFVTYPVVSGLHAGLRLDGTIDGAGAHANTVLLVLRLPLFGSPEAPARAPMTGRANYAPRGGARLAPVESSALSSGAEPESLLARLLDPSFYWQALRLDVPARWLTGGDDEAPSAVILPPVRVSQPGV